MYSRLGACGKCIHLAGVYEDVQNFLLLPIKHKIVLFLSFETFNWFLRVHMYLLS